MPKVVPPEKWQHYLKLRKIGHSMAAASRETGISYSTVKAFEAGMPTNAGSAYKKVRENREIPAAIALDKLSPEAKRALDDFGYFRRRYFGRLSTPWQTESGERAVELLRTPTKEYAVISCPPGSGKSTLAHDLAAWITVRNRGIRGMIGSASMSLAERYTLNLRTTFENPFPIMAEPDLAEAGLAVDAESTLVADYGGFKPENSTLWSTKAFIVAQHGDRPLSHKEPTWSAYGPDSAQIGGRYDFIIWDDLVDEKSLTTLESVDKLRRWFDRVAEKRLEPGGLLMMPGQRLSPEDLYRYCLDKEAGDADRVGHECCDAEAGRKYHHFKYRAHWEDRCHGDHGTGAAAWPKGCLLDPQRLPWRELEAERKASVSNFAQVYQQEDADPTHLLVDMLWIKGGTDPVTKEVHPGCWDLDRGLAELPAGLAGPKVSIITADPSPTRFWAVQWWIYTPESEFRWLMDLHRAAMDAPAFLDWNHASSCWTGLLEEWWQRSSDLGLPVTMVIAEANAAQRFMLQYEHVRRWMAARGVRVIGHETHRNKADPRMGVSSIAPHYRHGRVRLPGKDRDAGRLAALKLVDEVTKWPMARYDDCVMAHWFLEWNLPNVYSPPSKPVRLNVPSWVGGSRR